MAKKYIFANSSYSINNPPKGVTVLEFDTETNSFGIYNNKKASATIPVQPETDDNNTFEIKPIPTKLSELYNDIEYSAFEVMPTKVTIEANEEYKVDIPACTIHKMTLRSVHNPEECDVIIDWGDGVVESIKEGKYVSNIPGKEYVLEHDYAESMTEDIQKFIVKIYGKNYYTFRHNNSITTVKDKYSIPSVVETSYNLISRIFDKDLPIASHISNFASMCYGALRLLEVNIPHSTKYITTGFNFSSLFQYCSNLKSVIGFEDSPVSCGAIIGNMFSYCIGLEKTDFVIPTSATTLNYLFYYCESLTSDIAKLIPTTGFALDNINSNLAFARTLKLTGKIPAKLLWNSNKTFDRCNTAFRDSALADQAPKTWGGKA